MEWVARWSDVSVREKLVKLVGNCREDIDVGKSVEIYLEGEESIIVGGAPSRAESK